MKTAAIVLAALGIAAAHGAQAQIYRCKDANGRTITADRPMPECGDRPIQELNKNGMVRREIPAPMTAEERRRKEAEEEQKRKQDAVREEQQRADRAILARYRNEAEIEATRKRALDVVQQHLQRETAGFAALDKERKLAQAEVDAFAQKKEKPTAVATARLAQSNRSASEAKQRIAEQEAEIAKINEKFDATVKRFRELAASTAQKASAP